jgi:hypothetical protein
VSDVDILRRAAAKLREATENVTPGPWDWPIGDGYVWPDRIGDPVSSSEQLPDAAYIALMHPPVALALAIWLDAEADRIDSDRTYVFSIASYAAARAVLREDKP